MKYSDDSEPELPLELSGAPPDLKDGVRAAGPGTRAWSLALAAGLMAGLIAWACAESMLIPEMGSGTRGGKPRLLPQDVAARNAIVSFGILGVALGLGLGLAGGMIGRSIRSSVLAAVIGLVLGGVAGVGIARLTLPVYYENLRGGADLTYSLLVHAATWTAIGGAAGLAFGIGLGGRSSMYRGLLGGAGGALIASLVYELAGMVVFPLDLTDRPLSRTWGTRLLARLMVAVMAAAGVVLCGWRADENRGAS